MNMASFDDPRPVSMYDNLSLMPSTGGGIHTSTPKHTKLQQLQTQAQQQQQQQQGMTVSPTKLPIGTTTTAAAATASSVATAATTNDIANSSPYTDLSFKFNNNNNSNSSNNSNSNHSVSSHNNPQQQQQLLPNGSDHYFNLVLGGALLRGLLEERNTNNSTNDQSSVTATTSQVQPTSSNNNNNNITIHQHESNVTATTATATLTPPSAATSVLVSALPASLSPSPLTQNAFSKQRPLSQHSQSELYEASHSIAAVKAALNDAKSKFFGLNEPPQSTTTAATTVPLLESTPSSATKIVPKYQNIPENSAIYRAQQQMQLEPQTIPPELPPKPLRTHTTDTAAAVVVDMSARSTSPAFSATQQSTSPSASSVYATPSSAVSPGTSTGSAAAAITPETIQSQLLPHATYKQIPLNDIDTNTQPSQAVYMATTVPQNIKGSKIAGRHTPTRNSLRHSRMLVVNNKNYQGEEFANPLNFEQPILARLLLIFEIFIGLLLIALSIWIFLLAPNTAINDNPYWSGLTLLLAGIVGLSIIRFQRSKRHRLRENCFQFFRANSYLLTLLALLLCCIALTCATMHFIRLTANTTHCKSTNPLLEHGSCTCTFNLPTKVAAGSSSITTATTTTTPTTSDAISSKGNNAIAGDVITLLQEEDNALDELSDEEEQLYSIEYRELSCEEVRGTWTLILGISAALHTLGLLIVFTYIILLICCRSNSKHFYSSVHTSTF